MPPLANLPLAPGLALAAKRPGVGVRPVNVTGLFLTIQPSPTPGPAMPAGSLAGAAADGSLAGTYFTRIPLARVITAVVAVAAIAAGIPLGRTRRPAAPTRWDRKVAKRTRIDTPDNAPHTAGIRTRRRAGDEVHSTGRAHMSSSGSVW